MRFVFLLFIADILLINRISIAQDIIPGSLNSQSLKKHTFIQTKPGHITGTLIINDSLKTIDADMTEMVDIIVEYKDTPLFLQQKDSKIKKPAVNSYLSRQTQFSSDLSALYRSANKAYNVQFRLPEKKREYFKLFSGASMSVPRALVSMISSLPYVKKVYVDHLIKAGLAQSVKIIGADYVWNNFNDEGDSVIVGILDTGIDYLHPALGGGIGKGFKVIGGYDFVNRDNDPMDDHGHGTHVAGIVAGNDSSIKGVAPKALLMAYKVLNRTGEGFESDCIAAVERAVDPNEDNNFDDRLDVVNMSMGDEGGNPLDPLCQAVNNAVNLGVTFCISAGNSGQFNRISSPGSAELAITVGATEKSNRLADFSSKGPSKKLFAIKPEILAPGAGIYSCFPNGKYETLSGTSMASPMVAGVCALIKHKHKNWTPAMIKSALTTTARDYGLDVMSYGSGLVNAPKAMKVSSFAFPSMLNFGIDSMTADTWMRKDTITILNESESLQSYDITAEGLSSGITIDLDHSTLTLQPGQSEKIVFTLTVNNKTLPDLYMSSKSYYGKVYLRGTSDSLTIPWAFVKSPFLQVNFSKNPLFSIIYGDWDKYQFESAWTSNSYDQAEFILQKGSYILLSVFSDIENGRPALYFVEKFFGMNSFKSISAGPSDADKSISFNGVDERGRKLSSLENSWNNFLVSFPSYGTRSSTRSGLYYSLPPDYTLKISRTTSATGITAGQFQFDPSRDNAVRILRFPQIYEVTGDINLTNSPSGFLKRNITINQPEDGTSEAGINNCLRGSYGYISNINPLYRIKDSKWNGVLYITPETGSDFRHTAIVQSSRKNGGLNWISDGFIATRSEVGVIPMGYYSPAVYISNENDPLSFGEGPVYPEVYLSQVLGAESKLCLQVSLYGRMNELKIEDNSLTAYRFYDLKDNIISEALLPEGKSRFELLTNNYTVAGIKGKGRYYTELDLTDKNRQQLPCLTGLQVLNSSGSPTGILKAGDKGKISFSVLSLDENFKSNIDTSWTRLYLKRTGTTDWEEIKTGKRIFNENGRIDNIADVGKFADTDSSLIDLKIVTQNVFKQRIEWVMVPSFAIGNYRYKMPEEDDYTLRIPTSGYVLYNNFPNPFNSSTVISYGLPHSAHVDIRIYDVLGREVRTLVNRVQEGGQYKIEFNGQSLPSGMYLCSMKAGNYTKVQKILLVK